MTLRAIEVLAACLEFGEILPTSITAVRDATNHPTGRWTVVWPDGQAAEFDPDDDHPFIAIDKER